METFIGVFIYYFPMKKNQEKCTYIGLKLDFSFKLYAWRHYTMKKISYSLPFSSQELYLGVCLSVNKGNPLLMRK